MNKLMLILLISSAATIMKCGPVKSNPVITTADLDNIIQDFSERRLQYQLYSKQVAPSNREILQISIQNQNSEEQSTLKALRKDRAEVLERILAIKISQ